MCSVSFEAKNPAQEGQEQEEVENKDEDKDKGKDINPKYRDWVVCEIDPFIVILMLLSIQHPYPATRKSNPKPSHSNLRGSSK